jgi:hypothetical protein
VSNCEIHYSGWYLKKLPTDTRDLGRSAKHFWMDDDGENCSSNNWHYEDNYMLLKDTWKKRICATK